MIWILPTGITLIVSCRGDVDELIITKSYTHLLDVNIYLLHTAIRSTKINLNDNLCSINNFILNFHLSSYQRYGPMWSSNYNKNDKALSDFYNKI